MRRTVGRRKRFSLRRRSRSILLQFDERTGDRQSRGGEDPWVAGELGGFHFVQRISKDPAGRKPEVIAEQWVGKLVQAIRRHDESTPVTVGAIPFAFAWPNAKPVFYSPSVSRHLDFVSIHVYPNKGTLEKELSALAVYDIGKPLVIEEVFPMKLEELDAFVEGSSDRVDGWISHYFGYTAAEHRAGGRTFAFGCRIP